MSEPQRIADQLRRAHRGEAWHGPALRQLLAGVNARAAARRPLPGAHSIWELVLHITAWQNIARRRLESRRAVKVTTQQDWPPVTATAPAAWRKARAALEDSARKLQRAVERFDEARLEKRVPGKNHSFYVMLHGAVQHSAYHAGQIALLKKT